MSIPGFTADSSLWRSRGHYARVRSGPAAGVKPPRLTQQRQPADASRVQRVLPDARVIYGNWCGPFYGSGQPIDAVDRLCCIHDHCYDNRGYLDCSCDRDLISGMRRTMSNPYVSPEGRYKASQIADFFRISPCLCYRICIPWLGCFRSVPTPGTPLLKQCIPPYA